ncbi:MAG: DUF4105 domain-containing protein [Campylobacterales bacterium]|nr:DUF4105 domain-containing protein [Campylobacterales bacterium]
MRSFGLFGWLLGLHVSLFADLGVYHQKIDDERLYEARAWQLLLHVSGGESEMDDPAFFFSPEGKRDPRAELHAFIDRLYETDAPENNATACRFPARTAWALEALQLSDLPSVSCPKYDAFMRQIDPHSVTFVFADAHINSPASMFGHTFLRIDSTKESKLLSHAVSYAAGVNAQNENGLVFAVKGLLGGYKGLYSLTRYYDKLKEYTNVEQRDMWEYPLNLIQDEVKRMVMHIWELRNSYSMYYFFDENCAYHMLWLLEIARETVHLCAYYYYPVIPPETIFAIKQEGLVAGYDYRASKRTLLSNYATAFDAAQRRRVYALARGEEEPERLLEEYATPLQIRQWILEAAAERCEADYIGGTLAKAAYQERFLAILKARAALGAGEKRTVATPSNPALAHASGRLRYGFGVNDEGRQSHYLGIRSAYQDISESDTGRLRGTQIEFLDLLIGLRPVQKHADEVHTYLERFTLLSLGSYAPMDAFADPISWRMRLGADTQSLDAHPRAYAGVGAGVSVASDRGYGYMMVDPFGYYDASQTLWGGGGAVGGVFYPTQRFKIHAEYRHRWYASGRRQHLAHALCTFDMSRNAALTGSYEYVQRLLDDEQRTVLGVNLYF